MPTVKKLAGYIKEYKFDTIITPIMMLGEVVVEMMIPLLMAKIIDKGIYGKDMSTIWKVGAWMLLAAAAGLFFGIMGGKYGASASAGFAKNLRFAMFEKVQTYSFKNIDKFSSASLITRMTTDVTNLQNAFQMLIRMGMRAPASLIVALILSISISPRLSIVYLVAVAILTVLVFFLSGTAQRLFNQVFKRYDDLNAEVEENVSGIRVVKAYVREDFEKTKFEKANENLYKIFVKAESLMVKAFPIMMGSVYACILAISWFGAHLIIQDELTTGELMSMLTYCMNILMSIMMFAGVIVMVLMSTAAAQRVCEVLDEEPDIKNPEKPVMEVKNGSVEFENVDFSYYENSSEPVLKDINLKINSGETIGIIGPTGSGKTSLVNLLSRLYDVTKGSVKVSGVDVRDYDIVKLRDSVSVVLQNNVLFSGTIYENLRWGDKNASDEECQHAAKLACADEFIEKFPDGYDTYIEQGGSNVSGGQRQRLCIARALLKKPKILVLDDSTSAVDTTTDSKIRASFRNDIPDTTKFIIAQRISSVQDADRIIVMDDGKIADVGTHEELLNRNEMYRELYESQTGAGSGDFDKV
jgi:ATP-binding cassette subfamily B protein